MSYRTDGSILNQEGLYLSNPKGQCKLIKPLKIKDFLKNEEPAMTFGMRLNEMF